MLQNLYGINHHGDIIVNLTMSRVSLSLPKVEAKVVITKISCRWKCGLAGFYLMRDFIAFVCNSVNQNVIVND